MYDVRTARRLSIRALCFWLLLAYQPWGGAQSPRIYRDRVEPHWFANNTMFWYRVALPDQRHEFVLVDTVKGTRRAAFDHQRLAEDLAAETDSDIQADRLPFSTLKFDDQLRTVSLTGRGGTWELNLKSGELNKMGDDSEHAARQRFFLPVRKSVDKGGDVELTLVNQLTADVELVWIDREGQPVSYGTMKAKSTRTQHTFVGHVWLLQSPEKKPLAAFEASDVNNEIVVSEQALKAIERPRPDRPSSGRNRRRATTTSTSPDGQWKAFGRDHNLWLEPTGNQKDSSEFALTRDGTPQNTFHKDASRARMINMQYNLPDPPPDFVDVRWAPNGKYLLAFQTKKADEKHVNYVRTSPPDQFLPKVESYPYARAGEDIPTASIRLFDVEARKEITLSRDLMSLPFELRFLRWSDDGAKCWLLYNERGHQNLRVLEVSAINGTVTAVVDEHSDTFIHYSTAGKFELEWLPDNQILWASERSGWNHLYRYDLNERRMINAVTAGDWNVRRIERIDRENGVIWFYAMGLAKDQDPYHEHFCRVNFDGSEFRQLTQGDGTHRITFTEDRKFFFGRYSRVDQPPVTELRRSADGSLVTHLETADASEITATRRLPVRFSAKGRDDTTDIWGMIHFPLNFDPTRKYPVVEYIYAGPHDHHVPKSFRSRYGVQRVADRGIVVVQIDGMGTAWRSKHFHDVCYRNLKDAGFPDRIAWMKAAARKYSWMDISRVGIYGGSAGGQNAMAALLWHGTFYKVAVADCGCHDNRIDKLWWNEQWMGYPVGEHYSANSNADNAYRLQGRLMLVVGGRDRNVDPASTTRVVAELIKADKDFEFLLIPEAGHGAAESAYGSRRRADFLARHLSVVTP